MKHLVGIGVLTGMAFGLRCLLQTDVGFDMYIHDIYWVISFQDHCLLVPSGNCACLVHDFCVEIYSTPLLIASLL